MAAKSHFFCLHKILTLSNLSKEALHNPVRTSCISYQQRRHKKYYNSFEREQKEEWLRDKKVDLDPVLYDTLTEESLQYLEDEYVKNNVLKESSPLKNEPWARNTYSMQTRRSGLIAIKLGTIPMWKRDGTRIGTTLLQVLDNHAIKYTPPEQFQQSVGYHPKWSQYGYEPSGSQTVGAISCNPWTLHPDYVRVFKAAGVPPKRKLTRFLVTPDAALAPGTPLNVNHFNVGQFVDVSARTIFHGFQGVMKRWDFAGQPASHGATKTHRRPGTSSSGRKSGIWKGSKMPGLMGDRWLVQKGLKVWRINTKYNILYVQSTVPGPQHCFVRIYDSNLYKHKEHRATVADTIPMPTSYPDDFEEPLPEDIYDEEIFQFDNESITFAEEEEQ